MKTRDCNLDVPAQFAASGGSALDGMEEAVKQTMLQVRANCMPEVDALIAAGWRFELPEVVNRKDGEPPHMETEPWQWYWRRPPRRNGGKGMKFWSTTMAFNALKREAPNDPDQRPGEQPKS